MTGSRARGDHFDVVVSTPYTHKFHPSPRLSASQLGEYLSANATSRRRIITDAKYPPLSIITRYDDARLAIGQHLVDPRSGALNAGATRLAGKMLDSNSKWSLDTISNCQDAIESFRNTVDGFGLEKMTCRVAKKGLTQLQIADVAVSVSLDLHTEQQSSDGSIRIGGIVLLFAKTPKGDRSQRCEAAAVLIHKFLTSRPTSDRVCDPQLCIAIDVFAGKAYRAKKQHKTLYRAIETSCGEIATMWSTVPPPPGYHGPNPHAGLSKKATGR